MLDHQARFRRTAPANSAPVDPRWSTKPRRTGWFFILRRCTRSVTDRYARASVLERRRPVSLAPSSLSPCHASKNDTVRASIRLSLSLPIHLLSPTHLFQNIRLRRMSKFPLVLHAARFFSTTLTFHSSFFLRQFLYFLYIYFYCMIL